MKKIFFQNNIVWQLVCLIALVGSVPTFALGVLSGMSLFVSVIAGGISVADLLLAPSLITVGILLFCEFIVMENRNIYLNSEKMYMHDDRKFNKKDRIQCYAEVKFSDIASIDILWTSKNSKGEFTKSAKNIASPYLSIKTKEDKTANFVVQYITKKNVLKLIREIKARMDHVGNSSKNIDEQVLARKLKREVYFDIS